MEIPFIRFTNGHCHTFALALLEKYPQGKIIGFGSRISFAKARKIDAKQTAVLETIPEIRVGKASFILPMHMALRIPGWDIDVLGARKKTGLDGNSKCIVLSKEVIKTLVREGMLVKSDSMSRYLARHYIRDKIASGEYPTPRTKRSASAPLKPLLGIMG